MHEAHASGSDERRARSQFTSRIVIGLGIIALGLIITLDNMGLVEAGDVLRWWPILLVAYGAARLIGFGSQPGPMVGTLFVLGGGVTLLHNLGIVRWDIWDLWPVILVALGVSLVSSAMRGNRLGAGAEASSSTINAFAMMAGSQGRFTSSEFRGGQITAIMGGHDIDLRGARLKDGTAVIELLVWWGGVHLLVPDDWKVSCVNVVVMGGIDDHRKPPVGEPKGHLILQGLIVMGGVEIKS